MPIRGADLSDGVQPLVEAPDAPDCLSTEAHAEWHRIVPLLLDLGLLGRIDAAALTLYVGAWGRLQLVERSLTAEQNRLAEQGADPTGALIMSTPTGFSREATLSRLAGTLAQQVDRHLAAFGMSPAARSRVTASTNGAQMDLPGVESSPARFFVR